MRFAHLLFGTRSSLFGAGVFGAHAAQRIALRAQRAAWKAERAAWKAERRALRARRPFVLRVLGGLWSLAWLAFFLWVAFGFAFGGAEFRHDLEYTLRTIYRFGENAVETVVLAVREVLAGRYSSAQ